MNSFSSVHKKNILTAPFCIPSFIVELLQLVQEMA